MVRGNRSFNQPILPPPSVLQEYEYASDGAAARIIEMAEVEQDRRNKWEIEYMRFYKKSLRIGQLFGFLLLALVVLAVMSLSAQGKDQVAQVLGGSAFFAVAVASIFSGNSSRRNSRRPRYDRSRFPASEPDEKA
ncbi:MAG: putative rane protein [Rickettsiaceae bacterium]|nr:putative rane protein [Rickettsiaceae bacterium]